MWWDRNEDGIYVGASETLRRMADMMASADPPIDVVFGFSQGAALAALLAALSTNPTAVPAFADGLRGRTLAPLKAAVIVGGFCSADPAHAAAFARPIDVPSLHIIGRSDHIVTAERSEPCAARFVNARVEFHPGGHFTPSDGAFCCRRR